VLINSQNSPINGKIVKKESLVLSDTQIAGFKLHPLFINEDGEEVEYVLLSAYDGSVYDTSASTYFQHDESGVDFNADKLSSIAGVKPVSGENKALTPAASEHLANNRGEGWHSFNSKVDSAN